MKNPKQDSQFMLTEAMIEAVMKVSPHFKAYVLALAFLRLFSLLFFLTGVIGVIGLVFQTTAIWAILACALIPAAFCKGIHSFFTKSLKDKFQFSIKGP